MPYRKTAARIEYVRGVRMGLIQAGVSLLRKEGPEAVTVRAVVRRARSSVGSYYYHFKDKDELLTAMAGYVLGEREAEIDASSWDARAPMTALATMVATGIYGALTDRAVAELLTSPSVGRRVREAVVGRFVERTRRVFASDTLSDLVPNPGLTAVLWQGAILLALEQALAGYLDASPREVALAAARWNLTALGADRERIDDALDTAGARLDAMRGDSP